MANTSPDARSASITFLNNMAAYIQREALSVPGAPANLSTVAMQLQTAATLMAQDGAQIDVLTAQNVTLPASTQAIVSILAGLPTS